MCDPITLKDIQQAKRRIGRHINHTPVLSSSLLNHWLGHEVYFKAECMQKIGAFKARGACNTIAWLMENNAKPQHIVANSSGNHAQAVGWASGLWGIPSTIFMPKYSSKVKVKATQSYGAEIVLCEDRFEVDERAKQASKDNGAYWLHPYNHEQVIAGQGTATLEALLELDDIHAVFAPCGGGGLLSGTVVAANGLSHQTKVIGAEPLNANDAVRSYQTGSIQKLDAVPDTLADGAMTMAVGDITFEYLKKLDDMMEVEEERIVYWTQWLSHLLKIRIEPTSALAMEAALKWLSLQSKRKRILVILSGGNVDLETMLKIWERNCLDEQPGLYV